LKKIWILNLDHLPKKVGLAGQPNFFFQKTQKRGLVSNLDLLKKELRRENLANPRKNTKKLSYSRHPIVWFQHQAWLADGAVNFCEGHSKN
jgi:hypothetical protein